MVDFSVYTYVHDIGDKSFLLSLSDTGQVTLSSDSTLDNKIVDKKGSTLPSTGGMGTLRTACSGNPQSIPLPGISMVFQ